MFKFLIWTQKDFWLNLVQKNLGLDVSTTLAEQIKDPVLGTMRSGIRKKISVDDKWMLRSNNQKAYCVFVKNLIGFSSKLNDNCLAIRNLWIKWMEKTSKLAFFCLFILLVFGYDKIMKWVDR